jgi:hypothetical protein
MNASALELAGLLAGCGAAAAAIVTGDGRVRRVAILIALVVAPVLVAGDVWDEERVVRFRDDPAAVAAAALGALFAVAVLAAVFRRLPTAFPILAIALLPLRVPVEIGGETANLLIPLYAIIGAGAVTYAWPVLRTERGVEAATGARSAAPITLWLRWALAGALVAYAIQSAYSEDVSNAIENAGFFLVPFGVLLVLLLQVPWSRRLLGQILIAVGAMATVFAAIAIGQYIARDLFINSDLLDSNQLHLYFRVNSLFYDPNILGRYLAMAMVALAAYIAWGADPRLQLAAAAAAVISLVALCFSFSITSFAALLSGLGILALMRWRWRGALAACGLGAIALVAFALAGGTPSSEFGKNRDIDSGHFDLVEGGIDLFEDRPVAGWGSGAFGAAFFQEEGPAKSTVSHAEPITVAAEQGAVGILIYLALIGAALTALFGGGSARTVERSAIAACFVALLVHSLGYAAFATDPATWALLALGSALRGVEPRAAEAPERALAPAV